MPDPIAQYSFIPWLRQGIAARIAEADHLGSVPEAGQQGRAGLSVEVALEYVPAAGGDAAALAALSRRVQLLGPGDILGLKPSTVMRTWPSPDAVSATPGELAYVEFYEEDFPWRYTPARAATATEDAARQHKLRPWLALFVLQSDEFSLLQPLGEVSVLFVNNGVPLPPSDESWAWAHAQITGTVASAADVHRAIATDSDRSLSRLMSPRRLDPDTSYAAFVVPAFETGRLAGLKQPDPGTPAQKPSWGPAAADRRFPVYFSWSFKTGGGGDFESLARKLAARPVGPSFGKRAMDIGDVGYGMAKSAATVELEGALRAPQFSRKPFPDATNMSFARQLRAIVNLSEDLQDVALSDIPNPLAANNSAGGFAPFLRPSGGSEVPDDPIVTPPAYGRLHAGVRRVPDPESEADLAWLCELNLDPRSRAAAGLGAVVVGQLQDELMERAWKQVGEIEAANERLRRAELAAAAAGALHSKHVQSASSDRVLTLTSAAHGGLALQATRETLRGLITESRVPGAALSSTFKRVSRPQRKTMRRLTGKGQVGGVQANMLTRMNLDAREALSAAPPRPETPSAVTLVQVSTAVSDSLSAAKSVEEPSLKLLELLRDDLAARRSANENLATLPIATLRASLLTTLASPTGQTPQEQAFATRVRALIQAMLQVDADGPDGAVVTIDSGAFEAEFSGRIAGKTYRGVTVVSAAPKPDTEVARTSALGDVVAYRDFLNQFGATFVEGRAPPAPPPALSSVDALGSYAADRLNPRRSLVDRVTAALEGLESRLDTRAGTSGRPLRPVMAYPQFDDPMFEPLYKLSQDYVLPNVTDIGRDTITLLEPNTAFIEAYLAGLNSELGRELLWRGFPTDMRGTYMQSFWDTRDALGHAPRNDIRPMHEWTGKLGVQSLLPAQTLVLVIRGRLLQTYPNTIVYAHAATWSGGDPHAPRIPDPAGERRFPAFHATIDPDIAVYGFDLTEPAARGHRRAGPADPVPDQPGWFFVLKERPGQVRFGADDATPAGGFSTWDDLAWDQIPLADKLYARASGPGLPAPADPAGIVWGTSAAHVAYAMFQSPILYARHASEMLPDGDR